MIRLIYTLILVVASPFLLFGLYKSKAGKPPFGPRWKEHFGFTPALSAQEKPLWIHAVSVGEVVAATGVIKELKQAYPHLPILITTTTSTGAEQLAKLGDLIEHRYMPLDFPFAIKGFLSSISPRAMLIMETELWPNTLHYVAKANIPIVILNARLSERSSKRYEKVSAIFDLLAENLDLVLCQNNADAKRFIGLGLPKDKVITTGSVKFDISLSDNVRLQGKELRKLLGKDRPIWIAASTHQGEDEQILEAHKKLLKAIPNALLIIVPRHPERFSSVTTLVESFSLELVSRTSAEPVTLSTQVYIGDTMGEMLTLIGASDICVMCGSFIGNKVGGHNVLEPAALGIPTITGPSYFNFQLIVDQLVKQHGCVVIDNSNTLSAELNKLFMDKPSQMLMGDNAKKYIDENRGSISKTIQQIEKYI